MGNSENLQNSIRTINNLLDRYVTRSGICIFNDNINMEDTFHFLKLYQEEIDAGREDLFIAWTSKYYFTDKTEGRGLYFYKELVSNIVAYFTNDDDYQYKILQMDNTNHFVAIVREEI